MLAAVDSAFYAVQTGIDSAVLPAIYNNNAGGGHKPHIIKWCLQVWGLSSTRRGCVWTATRSTWRMQGVSCRDTTPQPIPRASSKLVKTNNRCRCPSQSELMLPAYPPVDAPAMCMWACKHTLRIVTKVQKLPQCLFIVKGVQHSTL